MKKELNSSLGNHVKKPHQSSYSESMRHEKERVNVNILLKMGSLIFKVKNFYAI